MVSRRRILSRSGDKLLLDSNIPQPEDEEDVWYQQSKLYKDHIQEILNKWNQIDDEIWAKVIVLERNRRVAKAYARAPVLTVNGSDDGFDGFRIGLCGFENPMRDKKTEEFRKHVGYGVKIKMDNAGNILVKRLSKCNVFVKNTGPDDENAIGNEILKLPGYALEPDKPFKLFDMKKFQSNINRELRSAYPDRRRLEYQCLSAIAFVKSEPELLECPIWVLTINVVAIEMLKSKLPPVQRMVDIKNRPRIPIPDEDPYSVLGNGTGSSDSSGFTSTTNVAAAKEQLLLQSQQHAQRRTEKPPKLPPRENIYSHNVAKPDYGATDNDNRLDLFAPPRDKSNNKQKFDDPYYCGLRARVPNFVSKLKGKESVQVKRISVIHQQQQLQPLKLPAPLPSLHQQMVHQQVIRKARTIEREIDADDAESPYSQIYGRIPIPTRGYIPCQTRAMYIGEWD